ncbi:hypothetical protein [Spirillospora sp. CA-128828]|uniref:hypothetical protein n=1 Tax=Spirillospora sp. CA-128828 TaxID=3240033 RepID=UPI003D926AAE
MAQLTVLRDALPDKQARFWREDDVVFVQLGRDLTDLEAHRIIREARIAYGVSRRRFLPFPLIPPRLRETVKNNPTPVAAIAGLVAGALVAGGLPGPMLPSDEPRPRRRPPAVAGPAPTPGPSTTTPTPPPTRTEAPSSGPSLDPARGDGPDPTVAPMEARPTRVRPSTTPPDGQDEPPPTTPPPASSNPPATPPPARDRCLIHLSTLNALDVRLLCI